MKHREMVAIALVAMTRGWEPGEDLRVWGRQGRALAEILGVRAGERGSVYLNREKVAMAMQHVKEHGWRGAGSLVEKNPDLVYPLTPEKAKRLLEKGGEYGLSQYTAKKIMRAYNERYPNSKLARLFRKIRNAKIRRWREEKLGFRNRLEMANPNCLRCVLSDVWSATAFISEVCNVNPKIAYAYARKYIRRLEEANDPILEDPYSIPLEELVRYIDEMINTVIDCAADVYMQIEEYMARAEERFKKMYLEEKYRRYW